jgi:hypothetical protein
MSELKVLVKILEFLDVVDIVTSGKKLVVVLSQTNNIFYVSCEPELRCDGLVFAKMINDLAIEDVYVINIFLFAEILKIVDEGGGIFVFDPAILRDEPGFQIIITLCNDDSSGKIIFLFVVGDTLLGKLGIFFVFFLVIFFFVFFVVFD